MVLTEVVVSTGSRSGPGGADLVGAPDNHGRPAGSACEEGAGSERCDVTTPLPGKIGCVCGAAALGGIESLTTAGNGDCMGIGAAAVLDEIPGADAGAGAGTVPCANETLGSACGTGAGTKTGSRT